MSLPATPPSVSESARTLRAGSWGWPVYAVQSALNDAAGEALAADGHFGSSTTSAVKRFQSTNRLKADGVVGPTTRAALSEAVCRRLDRELALPDGQARKLAHGEGGDNGSAVNWSVPGGVDCGLFQLRVLGPRYGAAALKTAFSPYRAGVVALKRLLARAKAFAKKRHPACPFSALQLAVLAHNWPWAADEYHDHGRLPSPNRIATWVPKSLPASAKTYDGWARFYIRQMSV